MKGRNKQQYNQQFQQQRDNWTGYGPQNWSRSDEIIKDDVCQRLYHSRDVDARNITVEVKEGVITLAGFVQSPQERMTAQKLLNTVPEAKGVHLNLQVGQQQQQPIGQGAQQAQTATSRSGRTS